MRAAATASVADATLVFAPGAGVICDTTNTTISASIAVAGWTLHDQYAAAGQVILKAPMADDATLFKYLMLDVSNAAYLQMHLYEGWANTTHVGTNLATGYATTSQQRLTLSTASSIAIAASARFVAMQSITAAGVGASNQNEWTGIFERSRLAPWDTVANGYSPVLITTGASFGHQTSYPRTPSYAPRYKNPAGGDYTTTDAAIIPALMGWSGESNGGVGIVDNTSYANSGVIKTKVPDGLGGFYTPFNEIQYRHSGKSFEGGSISSICDVWNTVSYPNNLDEVTKGANTYIVWQNTLYSTVTAYAATNGNGSANTLFPKG